MKVLILAPILFVTASAQAKYLPRLHELKCKDTRALAKEAVAYALVGAWEPFATHKCFQGETFKFFNPRAGRPIGEVTNLNYVTQFVRGRDSYSIKALRTQGDEYRIDVEFKINGRTFMTTYEYVPDPEYTAHTGICGYVVNPTHAILRTDCIDKDEWNRFKQILEARSVQSH